MYVYLLEELLEVLHIFLCGFVVISFVSFEIMYLFPSKIKKGGKHSGSSSEVCGCSTAQKQSGMLILSQMLMLSINHQ